jgi:integrase
MLRERKDVGRALSVDEEKRLLEAAFSLDSACYTAVVVGLNTAMRKDEIRNLRWSQIDFERRTLVVSKSKTEAGAGRVIPLNATAFETLAHWARRFPEAKAEHYAFPWCENKHLDPMKATKGWRTAWRHALRIAGFHCRFHDLRVTAITKLAEGQTSELTIMAIAGHVSRKMMEHYSRIRTQAKRTALDSLVVGPVNQNVHQVSSGDIEVPANLLN